MTEVPLPTPAVVEIADRPTVEPTGSGTSADDRGDWALMLVPATICLVMFVVAFWW
jgi:hypothetical protein